MTKKNAIFNTINIIAFIFFITAPTVYAAKKGGKKNNHFTRGKPFQYFQAQIDSMDSRLLEIEGTMDLFQAGIDTSIQDILNLQNQLTKFKQDLLSLKENVDSNDDEIKGLEEKIVDLQEHLEIKVAELLQALKEVKTDFHNQITLLQQQNAEYGEWIIQNQESINGLQMDLESVIAQLHEVVGNVAENQEEITSLQNMLFTRQIEINRIQADINALNQNIISNQEEINSLWQKIESISGDRQVISTTPNMDVNISDTKDRLWLFIGSVNYYTTSPQRIVSQLLVDGLQIDSWIQDSSVYTNSTDNRNLNFIKLYLIPAGSHTVNFHYDIYNFNGDDFRVRGSSFIGIALQ